MKRYEYPVLALLLIAVVPACSLFGEKTESPTKIRETLEVPPDLARPQSNDLTTGLPTGSAVFSTYASKVPESKTPDKAATAAASTPAPEPEPRIGVKLERDGQLRWLAVQESAEQTIPHVRKYLLSQYKKLEVDDVKNGIFETEWEERKVNLGGNAFSRFLSGMQSGGIRDKFRVRIETGRVAGTSEVYVSYQGFDEVSTNSTSGPETTWQPRATDVNAEAAVLAGIMKALGQTEQEAKAQIAKEAAGGGAVKDKDGLLLTQQDIDQAWRRVGQALDRNASFVIEDRDRHLGIYYVHDKSNAGAKRSSLFGGLLVFGDTPEVTEDRFQVVLKTVEGGTSLKVLDVKGKVTDSKNGAQLLDYLQKQLR